MICGRTSCSPSSFVALQVGAFLELGMLLRILIGESPFGCSIFRKKKKSKIFVKLSLMSVMCISLWFLLYLCLISFLDVKYICVAGQLSDLSKTLLQLKGYVFR